MTAQKAYWDLVFSEKDLAVKQASLELAKQTLEENKQKVEIGTMARIDVVQTQLDVAQRGDLVVGANGTVDDGSGPDQETDFEQQRFVDVSDQSEGHGIPAHAAAR